MENIQMIHQMNMNNMISQHQNKMLLKQQNFLNSMNYLQYMQQNNINNMLNFYNGHYFPYNNYYYNYSYIPYNNH